MGKSKTVVPNPPIALVLEDEPVARAPENVVLLPNPREPRMPAHTWNGAAGAKATASAEFRMQVNAYAPRLASTSLDLGQTRT